MKYPMFMVVWRPQPSLGLCDPADRRSQYASHGFRAELEMHDLVCSMDRKWDFLDYAAVERFLRSLKTERTDH